MSEIDAIRDRLRQKKKNKDTGLVVKGTIKDVNVYPKLYLGASKIMVLLIIVLSALIFGKTSPENKKILYDNLFNKNISFAKINDLYKHYLGGVLPFQDVFPDSKPVFKEKLVYKDANIYKDGVALTVSNNYLVPVQDSGIVVFIGNKEEYGNTVIIQQVNGVDLWYSNIGNVNVTIYDYVEKGSLLGEALDEKIFLVYKKEGKVLNYKDYLE